MAAVRRAQVITQYAPHNGQEVGVSRSDLRRAQGQVVHSWPLRLRWLGPESWHGPRLFWALKELILSELA